MGMPPRRRQTQEADADSSDQLENVAPTPATRKQPRNRVDKTASQQRDDENNRKARTRIAVALIAAIGSLCVTAAQGVFDYIHIDRRLANLRGVDIKAGVWGGGYSVSFNPPWTLGNPSDPRPPTGDRSYFIKVKFPGEKFSKSPNVFLTISGLDASNASNLRWKTQVTQADPDGFLMQVIANEDSQIYHVEGQWVAFQQ